MSATVKAAGHSGIARRLQRAAGDVGRADEPAVRIRVVGSPADVADTIAALRLVLDVQHVSQPFPVRGTDGLVRVYLHLDSAPAPGECVG
ncbi:hypothetical protein [Pseudofrankia asymbiotica]|uniref:Uncharacterized protein n=1 Tax=Pseudofrankia asymbiotica TaxID=1834516 RepID=A0A1V2IKG9_9ACTN|nr:hypothetical protein [Pseudofrankia asymbiotica]ONH33648.1 hypothetical protein BL253_01115 [Pseudofrankia asymbiotica]